MHDSGINFSQSVNGLSTELCRRIRYLNDELMGADHLSALRDHYRWTANGDQDHPAWAVLSSAATGTLRDYLSTADVIGTDDYTISDGTPPQVAAGSAG